MRDAVDDLQDEWAQQEPATDTAPAAITARVLRIARILQAEADAVLAEHGLTRAEFDILSLLVRRGRALTASELASELWTSPAGTTKRMQKLMAAGFIERSSNGADRRSVLVSPTQQARLALRPALEALRRVEHELLNRMSISVRTRLEEDLRTLLMAVDAVK